MEQLERYGQNSKVASKTWEATFHPSNHQLFVLLAQLALQLAALQLTEVSLWNHCFQQGGRLPNRHQTGSSHSFFVVVEASLTTGDTVQRGFKVAHEKDGFRTRTQQAGRREE